MGTVISSGPYVYDAKVLSYTNATPRDPGRYAEATEIKAKSGGSTMPPV